MNLNKNLKYIALGIGTLSCSLVMACSPAHTHTTSTRMSNVVEATCTEEGSYTEEVYCTQCGEVISKETKTQPAKDHYWNDGVLVKEATCNTTGLKIYTCFRDSSHHKEEEIPYSEHTWGNGVITTEPGCTTTGIETYTCSVCHTTKTEELPARGHLNGETVKENIVAATCLKEGSYEEVIYCRDCKTEISRTSKTIPLGDHSWDNGVVTTEPGCLTTGVKTYTCTVCKATKTEELAAAGHKKGTAQKEKVVEATCTSTGSYEEVYYCSVCDVELSRTPKVIDKKPHEYGPNDLCVNCGALKPVATYDVSANGDGSVVANLYNDSENEGKYDLEISGTGAMKNYSGYDIAPWIKSYSPNIISLIIKEGVTSIGDSAFINFGITSFSFPSSITSIGEYAFSSCEKLTSIDIPDTVTSIDYCAFGYCTSLKTVTLGKGINSISTRMFSHCTSLEEVTIPETVTSISYGAFEYCSSLKNIKLPDSLTKLGEYLFQYCTSLQAIVIPDGVTSIGTYTFNECKELRSVTIGKGVTYIDYSAFASFKIFEVINKSELEISYKNSQGCLGVRALEIRKEGESKIVNQNDFLFYTVEDKHYMLGYVGSDSDIVLPRSYNGEKYAICHFAFYDDDNLTSVLIPDSIEEVEQEAFENCSNVTIYCEAISKPSGFKEDWVGYTDSIPVVWGYQLE